MIEEYHYGSITINGKTFNYDVEVRWTPKESLRDPTGQAGKVLKWWKGESHIIDVADVTRAIEQSPDVIVIGISEVGKARVTEPAKKEIRSRGIELMIDLTGEATKTFNIINEESQEEEGEQRRVIGLFHL